MRSCAAVAKSCLEVGRSAEVVGMCVGFEDVMDVVVLLSDQSEQGISVFSADAGGTGVEVQDWVDDHGSAAWRVGDDVLEGACGRLEDGVNDRFRYKAGGGTLVLKMLLSAIESCLYTRLHVRRCLPLQFW